MTAPVLELVGVSKSFGGLKVVSDVSFSLQQSGRLALIGPNGAGKTTVFNLISGVYRHDAGEIRLDGRDISDIPSRRRIGLGLARSFQNIRLMPHLSAIENVMLAQHCRASDLKNLLTPISWLPKNSWRREAIEILAAAGITVDAETAVSALPYGLRKQIEVVRALVARPKVLLLDEPAAGLNPRETEALAAFLNRVASGGTSLLLVEHDMHFVKMLCQDVVVLNFGEKIFEGRFTQAQADPKVREAYLGQAHAKGGDFHAA